MSSSDSNGLTCSASAAAGRTATADSVCRRPSPSSLVRLQKHLAACGLGSRRACESLIAGGHVTVNGAPVERQGLCIDPATDDIRVDGRQLTAQTFRYWLLYKPRGVVSTCHDPQGRRTVLDLVPHEGGRLYPVGRLDYDSEGLLLMTNDGALSLRLTHPRHEIDKTYRVQVSGVLSPQAIEQARRGVESEGESLRVAAIEPEQPNRFGPVYRIVLRQGRKRQIRRILAELGCRVTRLTRIAMGPLRLGLLKPGERRELMAHEVRALYRAAGLGNGSVAAGRQGGAWARHRREPVPSHRPGGRKA